MSEYVKLTPTWFCPADRYAGKETGPQDNEGVCHAYSSYVFRFGKTGRLRSSGLVGLASRNPRVLELGTPARYILIRDARVLARNAPPLGPHYDGIYNCIYLDGHLYVERPLSSVGR